VELPLRKKKRLTERTSSFVHSSSMLTTILKLLLCLFTSPEVVTITAIWWRIYVPTEPMLANSMQESFQRDKTGNLTFQIALVFM
jgi:hypothetical protein